MSTWLHCSIVNSFRFLRFLTSKDTAMSFETSHCILMTSVLSWIASLPIRNLRLFWLRFMDISFVEFPRNGWNIITSYKSEDLYILKYYFYCNLIYPVKITFQSTIEIDTIFIGIIFSIDRIYSDQKPHQNADYFA